MKRITFIRAMKMILLTSLMFSALAEPAKAIDIEINKNQVEKTWKSAKKAVQSVKIKIDKEEVKKVIDKAVDKSKQVIDSVKNHIEVSLQKENDKKPVKEIKSDQRILTNNII